ncbi:MAG: hypothetical protein AAB442_00240 [Patescibacteria group bacterium]
MEMKTVVVGENVLPIEVFVTTDLAQKTAMGRLLCEISRDKSFLPHFAVRGIFSGSAPRDWRLQITHRVTPLSPIELRGDEEMTLTKVLREVFSCGSS